MEPELSALAMSAATAMVSAMVGDAWTQASERIAGFFGRRGRDPEAVSAELEESRTELVAAEAAQDTALTEDIESEWRLRLSRALRADPAAAQELRALLAEIAPEPPAAAGSVNVNNTISGGTQNAPVVQGQNFNGLTLNWTPPQPGQT
ncbi:hypothetical protein [Streptomyces sp. NPDC002054]|uniref:hypothetical protein n=1 Tax=Streptomyces sp. NPDC002054 TaxID=3154663 RepID=UPI00332C81C3